VLERIYTIVAYGGFKSCIFLIAILRIPLAIGYRIVTSIYGKRNEKRTVPTANIEEFISTDDPEFMVEYHDKEKIFMQIPSTTLALMGNTSLMVSSFFPTRCSDVINAS